MPWTNKQGITGERSEPSPTGSTVMAVRLVKILIDSTKLKGNFRENAFTPKLN